MLPGLSTVSPPGDRQGRPLFLPFASQTRLSARASPSPVDPRQPWREATAHEQRPRAPVRTARGTGRLVLKVGNRRPTLYAGRRREARAMD